MPFSMTGFGEAKGVYQSWQIQVEIKSVNNRYLKVVSRLPDDFTPWEFEFEKMIRETISRGTITLTLRLEAIAAQQHNQLNSALMKQLWEELQKLGVPAQQRDAYWPAILQHPAMITEQKLSTDELVEIWPVIQRLVQVSLQELQHFRTTEGNGMTVDLDSQVDQIVSSLKQVAQRAPSVIRDYQSKLQERIQMLLTTSAVTIVPEDLLREVAIFADRCDINEEITRLETHLLQFKTVLQDRISQGRKLEFICQEISREINTIGSKANDAVITSYVVEMKTFAERIREILQNLE